MNGTKWTEASIGRVLARGTFAGALCVLPNTLWTGDEIDMLVLTKSLHVVDVEIKISRADLKRDADKAKWWHHASFNEGRHVDGEFIPGPRTPKAWPRRVWKHYYAIPETIWKDELLEFVQPVSGVLVVRERGGGTIDCIKRARPCRDADTLTPAAVVDIARLASLRMWDAYLALERAR